MKPKSCEINNSWTYKTWILMWIKSVKGNHTCMCQNGPFWFLFLRSVSFSSVSSYCCVLHCSPHYKTDQQCWIVLMSKSKCQNISLVYSFFFFCNNRSQESVVNLKVSSKKIKNLNNILWFFMVKGKMLCIVNVLFMVKNWSLYFIFKIECK